MIRDDVLFDKMYSSTKTRPFETGEYKVELPTPHINQEKVLRSKKRFRVVASGRRFGKSALSIIACVLRLFKGQNIWHCSPTNQNAKRIFREFIKIFRGFPESHVIINKTDMRIDLLFNDSFIEFKSLAEPENLRGEGLDFIVVDEAAFCQDNIWDEILMPMLLGREKITGKEGEALFISSTNGRNWFWRMFQRGLDPENTEYESFQFTSYDNPLIKPSEIDSIRKSTPTYVFEREYLAVFEESGGQVFKQIDKIIRNFETQEHILQYADKEVICVSEEMFVEFMLKKAQNDECNIVFGIDWAQKEDFTVITVFDLETNVLIEYHRFNKMLWEDILNEIMQLYQKWNPIYILAEENNSKMQIEQLQKEGLPIEGLWTGSKSKPELINKLVLAIEQKEISIPNDKLLIGELSAFEMTQTKVGNIKYSAPIGLNDDIVLSLCFSNWCRETVLSESAYKIISI